MISDFGKPRYNEGIQLQESSKLFQIQCLSESNNNITDSSKLIQSHILFNNCSQSNASSLVIMGKKNFENDIINQTENTRFLNYKHSQSTNNSSLLIGIKPSNEVHTENNYIHNAHSSDNIEDDEEDVSTNQAIMSLALKISEQDINFNCSDDFDEQIINNSSSSSFFGDQNGDQNVDSFKLEEEYKMTNSLKILESLVNIEHNKLEVQKSLTKNESNHPSNESFEKKQTEDSNKTNSKKNKSRKSKKKELENIEKEEKITTKEYKNHCFEYQSKKRKTHKGKSYRSEATSFSSTNNGTLDVINSNIKISLTSQNTKDDLPSNELKTHPDNDQSITFNKKELNITNTTNSSNNSDIPAIKVFPIASTSNCSEKYANNSKKQSSNTSGSLMKTSDYKKLYEKDRKSLFSPDIIITSKPSKDCTNNCGIKKENNHLEKKDDCSPINTSKSRKSKLKMNNNKKKVSYSDTKVTITNRKRKEVVNTKSVSKRSSTSSSNQKLPHTAIGNSLNKYKRLRMHESLDEIKNNSDTIETPLSETANILNNKNIINTETLENNETNLGSSEYQSLPGWLKAKCELYRIKPLYIVVNPNITYN